MQLERCPRADAEVERGRPPEARPVKYALDRSAIQTLEIETSVEVHRHDLWILAAVQLDLERRLVAGGVHKWRTHDTTILRSDARLAHVLFSPRQIVGLNAYVGQVEDQKENHCLAIQRHVAAHRAC